MDNTREKLIVLLASEPELLKNLNIHISKLYKLADHLIANGVTFYEYDCHWATEQAYKNGYKQGFEDGKQDAMGALPCKPGDTVYFIMCRTDGNHEIKKGFALSVEYFCSYRPLVTIRYNNDTLDCTKHYLGLKAFMTYDEAKLALAKMDGERKDNGICEKS